MHFVDVTADGFGPLLKLTEISVRGHREQISLPAVRQTPEHAVEQSPSPGVPVRRNAAGTWDGTMVLNLGAP
jgi:hypothetical protein